MAGTSSRALLCVRLLSEKRQMTANGKQAAINFDGKEAYNNIFWNSINVMVLNNS